MVFAGRGTKLMLAHYPLRRKDLVWNIASCHHRPACCNIEGGMRKIQQEDGEQEADFSFFKEVSIFGAAGFCIRDSRLSSGYCIKPVLHPATNDKSSKKST